MPLIGWGIIALGSLWGLGYAADKAEGALEEGADLAKWAAVLGALYLAYSIHKQGGFLK